MANRNHPRYLLLAAGVTVAATLLTGGCSGEVGSQVISATTALGAGRPAGYHADESGRNLTIFLEVDQLTTLNTISVVDEGRSRVTVRFTTSRRSGNAVAMMGYVYDTVHLKQPLGERSVAVDSGVVMHPLSPSEVGPSLQPRKTSWTPG